LVATLLALDNVCNIAIATTIVEHRGVMTIK
jgi:hypothetical protein